MYRVAFHLWGSAADIVMKKVQQVLCEDIMLAVHLKERWVVRFKKHRKHHTERQRVE